MIRIKPQWEKQLIPNVITLGSVTSVKLIQPEKQLIPNVVTLGSVMSVKLVQSAKQA